MKKQLPFLISIIMTGISLPGAYASERPEVDDITMDVIEHGDPREVTHEIRLPEHGDHDSRDDHAHHDKHGDKHDSRHEDSHDDDRHESREEAHEESREEAHEESRDESKEDAHDSAQESAESASDDRS